MFAIDWNSVNFWAGLIVTFGFLTGMVWGGIKGVQGFLKWWHKRLAATVADDLQYIKAQTQNNGGLTLRDAIDRIERTVSALDSKLDKVQTDLDRHLGAHEGL